MTSSSKLRCFCRERGSCNCSLDENDVYHFCTDLGNPCECIEDVTQAELAGYNLEICECVLYPASSSPSYLVNTHDVLRRGAR